MRVTLIGKPQFLGLPEELGAPRDDQLVGPDASKIIETAGRTCYDSFGKGRNSYDYSKHILESGHGSVLEHAQFTFLIAGVSRGLTHELVRHRVGVAISQRSTRYVDENESPWVTHPLLAQYLEESKDAELADEAGAAVAQCRKVYSMTVERLQAFMVSRGADKLTARKQARGAARGFLGNALETELIWSANVRALRTVLTQRASPGADAEIRAMAIELHRVMTAELPAYFLDYVVTPSPDGLGDVAASAQPKV